MRRWLIPLAVAITLLAAQPVAAAKPDRGVVRTFVDLSTADCHNPEGIAVSPNGTLFTAGLSGKICFLSARTGSLVRAPLAIPSPDGKTPVALLGELFVPDRTLYVADIGDFSGTKGRVLKVNPWSGSVRELATGLAAPNAFALDRRGRLFVSDSFAGAIYTIDTERGGKTLWKADPLLQPGVCPPFCPGFGANGVAFDRAQSSLYVANTSRDRILRIAVNKDGSAGAISIFADGLTLGARALDGADGIQFDVKGNLYVCANQVNEIHVLSPGGALIARYGNNPGDDKLDFPASPIFHGKSVYIANLALDTPGVGKISVLGVPWPGAPSGR
jgi:sugar lactone lactonase YvrE